MIPGKSLTSFLADTSQIPNKKLAQLWLANSAGAERLVLSMSSSLHSLCLLPLCCPVSFGSITAGHGW